MITVDKLKRMLRGDVTARTVVREALRRVHVSRARRREREQLAQLAQRARLCERCARMTASDILAHFQTRATPRFFPGVDSTERARWQQSLFLPKTPKRLTQDR